MCITGVAARDGTVRAVRHGVYMRATSITSLFEQGVVQMKGAKGGHDFFGSSDPPYRIYSLGGGTALDARFPPSPGSDGGAPPRRTTVLLSSSSGSPYWSGFQRVMEGNYSNLDSWDSGWHGKPSIKLAKGTVWSDAMSLAPNDRNFPPPDAYRATLAAGTMSVGPAPALKGDDLEALHTAIYGSAVGCLMTYPNEVVKGETVAQVATTIARPDRGYGGTYNYFDPDNYLTMSALIYSGEPYLQQQARVVIERSGAFLKPNGQLPHHFVDDKPTYAALSGATQTGPNTFWTLSALSYARNSGDLKWLKEYMPTLRKAASFCFDLIEAETALVNAPGSLMIDVFIRANFTADSNAMIVGFLREFAEAEDAVDNATGAALLRGLATNVSNAVNAKLWAEEGSGGDHYITQLNPDGTTRDFIDYDANLIAVAHGVPEMDRARQILARVDSGRCSFAQGAGPQFVSEVWYGKNDTTHGNVGDSWCSMGRIALFDARARKRMGGQAAVASVDAMLTKLEHDLLRGKESPWMHERYGCDGQQQSNRTYAYFEYPSLVAMLLREVRYGIRLGFQTVSIAPFGPAQFVYDVGNVHVDYAQERIAVSVPGSGNRSFIVDGLDAGARFAVARCDGTRSDVSVSAGGVLTFEAPAGESCTNVASVV